MMPREEQNGWSSKMDIRGASRRRGHSSLCMLMNLKPGLPQVFRDAAPPFKSYMSHSINGPGLPEDSGKEEIRCVISALKKIQRRTTVSPQIFELTLDLNKYILMTWL